MTAAAAPSPPISAHDLCEQIRRRYEPPEWHCEAEVTIERRRLDVVAFNMWGARKWRIVGFEIKVRRGDWLKELQNFQKSEGWLAVCDAFYVVTTPGLVKSDELPEGWGHLELAGSRLMTKRAALAREPLSTFPRELAARFLTRMVRDVDNAMRTAEAKVSIAMREEIENSFRQKLEERSSAEEAEFRQKAARYDEIIKALGLTYEWKPADRAVQIGRLVARLRADTSFVGQVERMARAFDEPLAQLKEIATALKADLQGATS